MGSASYQVLGTALFECGVWIQEKSFLNLWKIIYVQFTPLRSHLIASTSCRLRSTFRCGMLRRGISSRSTRQMYRIAFVAFSPDGTRIASGSTGAIHVRNTKTAGIISGPLQGHTDNVNSVMFSPDGVFIVSGSSDCTVRLWNAETGDAASKPFQGHTDIISSPHSHLMVHASCRVLMIRRFACGI